MRDSITRRGVLAGAGAGAIGTSLSGCLGMLDDDSIGVSSKEFSEQFILANISQELLEADGHETEDSTGLGGTMANFEALRNEEVGLYWEYTGTAWLNILEHEEPIDDSEELYQQVAAEYEDDFGIEWLEPAPFNNTYVIVSNDDWVDETGVSDLEELSEHAQAGNTDFSVGMNPEIEDREDGWAGLPDTYEFEESADDIETVNMDLGLAVQAVDEGEVDVAFAFETDAEIERYDLEVIDDTRNHFVIYNPAPNVRQDVLTEDIRESFNSVTPELDAETIRELNGRVSIDGDDPGNVAHDFLETNGHI
ncbi:glycine/betaine ABC transporter substrate-binding protein [Natrarchaeobius halalkaliphilus]|uniref:Glycine/betaine ABC transporter substrate-binding protein n=1 Tax=Natrarchaeobius halalkaliphilus TaxID=1679091 RepID=A0A3N6LKI5_9EURY|nr:glycine betaine ABC transporter substrate-binding protein [Natrarchaeobius halalkaliphilus]RQG86948.1 glycine/betaine ABC transporter substrate-binding protein [Natrarchaeobius halalkaliphilus]